MHIWYASVVFFLRHECTSKKTLTRVEEVEYLEKFWGVVVSLRGVEKQVKHHEKFWRKLKIFDKLHEENLVVVLIEHSLIKFDTLSLALPLCKTKKKCEIYVEPTKEVGKVVATYISGFVMLQKELLELRRWPLE